MDSQLHQNRRLLDTIGTNLALAPNKPDLVKTRFIKKRDAKAMTKNMMNTMFGLQNSPNLDAYRQAYMCGEYIFQNGKKTSTNHCKKRCCQVCNRIRSKQLLEDYLPSLSQLGDLWFVTLTNVNVTSEFLADELRLMVDVFQKIKNNIRKKYKQHSCNGFRSMECTYSLHKHFNPHIHAVFDSEGAALESVRQWLVHFPKASLEGQHVVKMYDGRKGLIELFKYVAKPITSGYYSPKKYDDIITAFKNLRAYQPFGNVKKNVLKEEVDDIDETKLKSQFITWKGERIEVWKWLNESDDWVAPDGELFLDEKRSRKLDNTLKIINKAKVEVDEKIDTIAVFEAARPRGSDDILF